MSAKIDPNVARKLGVRRFDASEYLCNEADIAAYLEAASVAFDPSLIEVAAAVFVSYELRQK
jgi:DNA-binding phage protein